VEIEVEQMNVQVEGDEALVTFVQDYRSDKYHDFGLKTLILSKKDQSWRIREESWKDMSAGAKP
jgi:ketosteroid isomerase-like protein